MDARRDREQIQPLPPPVQFSPGWLTSLTIWWSVRAVLGIGFVVGLTKTLGGSIWLGVTIGCAVAFVAAFNPNGGQNG